MSRRGLTFRLAERARAIKRSMASGDVLAATTDDAEAIGQLFECIASVVGSVVAIVIVTYLMLSVSVPLGLTLMVGMPVVLGLMWLVGKPLEARQDAVREAQGELTTIATDAVQGLRILKGVGGEAQYAQAFADQSAVVRAAGIKAAVMQAWIEAATTGAPLVLVTIVVAQGAFLVMDGVITAGQLVAFYGYTFYLRMPLWVTGRLIESYTRARVGTQRMAAMMQVTALTSDEDGAGQIPVDWTNATLSLGAPEGNLLTLAPGKITGLITPTTAQGVAIGRAFARVEDPTDLRIDGQPANRIPLRVLRSAVLLAEAIPQIFAGTLREALLGRAAELPQPLSTYEALCRYQVETAQAWGHNQVPSTTRQGQSSTHAGDAWLQDVITWAHATDVIQSLPGGLDGQLIEQGRNLSGGQRQRVALARAYCAHTPVLLLVEPTSAQDAHTEAIIGANLQAARGGQTTLVISQSPSLLRHCDVVMVVNTEGDVIAQGPFAKVWAIWQAQPSGGTTTDGVGDG